MKTCRMAWPAWPISPKISSRYCGFTTVIGTIRVRRYSAARPMANWAASFRHSGRSWKSPLSDVGTHLIRMSPTYSGS